jgi:hypothetical protein
MSAGVVSVESDFQWRQSEGVPTGRQRMAQIGYPRNWHWSKQNICAIMEQGRRLEVVRSKAFGRGGKGDRR